MSSETGPQRRIGPYRLLRLLGEGGAAHTWLAEDTTSGEQLAIKELRLVKSSRTKQIELFERECAILKDLGHPQIPKFIDTIVERHSETLSLFLVQEFIEGQSLQQLIDAGESFDASATVAIMKSCLVPLEYLHERRPPLYHRDIKPSNIIRRPDGSCVLLDFGAVREAIRDSTSSGSSVVGTFGYMAPEQFQARAYAATDLYGLAATALHLLSGVEPGRFPLTRLKPDIHAHLETDPHLAAILDILLEPTPEDRYSSARSLINALERWETTYGTDAVPAPDIAPPPTQPVPRLDAPAPDRPTRPIDRTMGSAALPPVSPDERETEPAAEVEQPAADVERLTPSPTIAFVPPVEPGEATSQPSDPDERPTEPAAPVDEEPGDAGDAEPSAQAASAQASAGDDVEETDAPPETAPEPTQESRPSQRTSAIQLKQRITDAQKRVTDAQKRLTGEAKRIAVQTTSASPLEVALPGGQGATSAGIGLTIAGVAVAAFGLLGPLEYNEQIWIVVGGLVAAYGLALLLTPRRRPTRGPSGEMEVTEVRVEQLVKRIGPLGSVEWYVDYSFLARDDLHYEGQFRLPGAQAAREVAADPSRLRVRYAVGDPLASTLLFRKG